MTVARVREAEEGHLRPDPGLKLLPLTDIEIFKGLSGYVTEDELRSIFQGFGEITYVKIPRGKGCGFVQFVRWHATEMAINQMPVPHTGQRHLHLFILPWACRLKTSTVFSRLCRSVFSVSLNGSITSWSIRRGLVRRGAMHNIFKMRVYLHCPLR